MRKSSKTFWVWNFFWHRKLSLSQPFKKILKYCGGGQTWSLVTWKFYNDFALCTSEVQIFCTSGPVQVHNFIPVLFGDVSSGVEQVQKYQYMAMVDRHAIIFVEQPRPFVQNFASKGAKFCKNMHLFGAEFSKKIAFEWSRLTATAIFSTNLHSHGIPSADSKQIYPKKIVLINTVKIYQY